MSEKISSTVSSVPLDDKKTSTCYIESVPVQDGSDGSSQNDSTQQIEKDWTDQEERRLLRKIDSIVMPLLILGFVALQFDRGNMGNAMTDFFLHDVKITQAQFNLGQLLLSLGVVLFEIPNNLCFFRFGPRRWLTGQMFCWGLVATMQAFYRGKGFGIYVVTRILLGLSEAGYSGSSLFTMTMWYKRDETSKRFAIFYVGNAVAHAVGGLMSTGILHMRGIKGLAGWQWLFIICGCFTILAAAIFGLLLPESPHTPYPFTRLEYFTQREKDILIRRVLLDDPTKFKPRKHISFQELKVTLSDWRVIMHALITITGHAPSSTMSSYAPSLVKGFGYDRIKSNAIASIGTWCLAVNLIIWGVLADRLRKRGPMVSLGLFFWCFFALGSLIASYHHGHKSKVARLAVLLCGLAFSTVWHPTNASWVSLNARSPGERSVRMAMMTMATNCGSMIGNQLFQAKDKPRYHHGWTAIVSLLAFAFFLSLFANFQYWYSNRKLGKRVPAGGEKGEANSPERIEEFRWYL